MLQGILKIRPEIFTDTGKRPFELFPGYRKPWNQVGFRVPFVNNVPHIQKGAHRVFVTEDVTPETAGIHACADTSHYAEAGHAGSAARSFSNRNPAKRLRFDYTISAVMAGR